MCRFPIKNTCLPYNWKRTKAFWVILWGTSELRVWALLCQSHQTWLYKSLGPFALVSSFQNSSKFLYRPNARTNRRTSPTNEMRSHIQKENYNTFHFSIILYLAYNCRNYNCLHWVWISNDLLPFFEIELKYFCHFWKMPEKIQFVQISSCHKCMAFMKTVKFPVIILMSIIV